MHIMEKSKRPFFISVLSALLILFSCGAGVENLGIFGTSRMEQVLGQDGVTPIPISDTITIWTFGDTILGSWRGDISASATFSEKTDIIDMISNSLAFTEKPGDDNLPNLKFNFQKKNGKVCQFINHTGSENPKYDRFWAVDGLRIGGRVYVYYLIIKISGSAQPLSFRLTGIGLAKWDIPAGWKPGDNADFKRLPDLFKKNDFPAFGTCVLNKNGYIYTVGQYVSKDKSSPIKAARVKTDNIEKGSEYEFLAKDGTWIKDAAKADPFLGDVMGESSLSYNEKLGKYVILYCQIWTGKIIMVTFGDFSELATAEKREIYEMPKLNTKGMDYNSFYYSGKEIFSTDKFIYAICINPVEYQPYLLRIKY
jgi:hypothetical protein